MDQLTHLLLDARDGDRDAFATAIRLVAPTVERFVGALADSDEVDDVVQDTFVRAWRSLPRFRAESSGRTWVLVIARNACADAIRARVRWRELQQRCAGMRPLTTTDDGTGSHALEALVDSLDPDRREAFVLTQVLGLSYAEAAHVCAVPIGTIRSRVARARGDLMGAMVEEPRERTGS